MPEGSTPIVLTTQRRLPSHAHTRRGGGGGGAGAVPVAKLEDAATLIDSVETFIFDCDGVIWKGEKLIDGVLETLDMLDQRARGWYS
ncbi:Os12g0420000 [Oryza sativa Japonica Group]|uniref:Os12g0420000 protein n=1 Tax=Oryza sativa subsp. japonica TaxID=39947 RepID=A0A0P0Y9D9_ORYSJ|nr:Os12g0420000 [Oryza sativa Japonica Group]